MPSQDVRALPARPSETTGRRALVRVSAGPRAVAELVVRAEDRVLQPAARLRPGDRVEEDPERDAHEQQAAVPALVGVRSLNPVRRAAEILDRRAELVLDLLVGRDLGRDARHAAVAEQFLVD